MESGDNNKPPAPHSKTPTPKDQAANNPPNQPMPKSTRKSTETFGLGAGITAADAKITGSKATNL